MAFRVVGDGRVLPTPVRSGRRRRGAGAADVTGVRRLTLEVTDGGDDKDSDHADWADAH